MTRSMKKLLPGEVRQLSAAEARKVGRQTSPGVTPMPFLTAAAFGPPPRIPHNDHLRKYELLPIEYLRQKFLWNPDTGIIRNLRGRVLGSRNSGGYLRIAISERVQVKAHRLLWALVHGVWPHEIDHKDGNKLNNALSNLRNVPRDVNRQNRVPGRCIRKVVRKDAKVRWVVQVKANGLSKSKTFASFCEAVKHRDELLASRPARSFR
jgi:hypothetical protein